MREFSAEGPAAPPRAVIMLLWQAGDTLLWPARLILCGSMRQHPALGTAAKAVAHHLCGAAGAGTFGHVGLLGAVVEAVRS